jgi:hypothetical protein
MGQDDFGIEGVTKEDRSYKGSRFFEVRDALFANPYQKVWGAKASRRCPISSHTFEPAAWHSAFWPAILLRSSRETHCRLARGLALGSPPSHSSEWRMPDGPLGDNGSD